LYWKELQKAESEGLNKISLGSTPSNPNDIHHKVKKSLGATFLQQEVVWIPTNAKGHLLLQIRKRTENLWKKNRDYLPRGARRIVENKLLKL